MAVAVTITDRISLGHTDYMYIGSVTLDNSYPTGGEALDLTLAAGIPGPTRIKALIVGNAPGGNFASWDPVNQKVKVFTTATTEAANASDQSGQVIPFVAIGP